MSKKLLKQKIGDKRYAEFEAHLKKLQAEKKSPDQVAAALQAAFPEGGVLIDNHQKD